MIRKVGMTGTASKLMTETQTDSVYLVLSIAEIKDHVPFDMLQWNCSHTILMKVSMYEFIRMILCFYFFI